MHYRRQLLAALLLASALPAHAAVTISNGATSNMSCSAGVCTATAQKAVLNAGELAAMLSSGDATVKSGSLAKDIHVDAKLSWVSGSRLILDSYRSIDFTKTIDVAGPGAMTITTNDGGVNGDYFFFSKKGQVRFRDYTSNLVIHGHQYRLVKGINDLATKIHRTHGPGYYALARDANNAKHTYSSSPVPGFAGVFEGLGHTISNLKIHAFQDQDVAFIGIVDSHPTTIRDIGFKDVDITTMTSTHCIATVVAYNEEVLQGVWASGTISASGSPYIGGLVCNNSVGTIRDSHASVDISVGESSKAIGGLVAGHISFCFMGTCTGIIDRSYATGSVFGGDSAKVGGLIGYNFGGIVTNSYVTGAVSGGANASVGGFIGTNENNPGDGSNPVLTAVYSNGAVTGGSGASLGGLIGTDLADPNITAAYWDMNTSGIADPNRGAGNMADDPGITGLTTAQFLSGLPAGFAPSVWAESPGLNGGYPYLVDIPPQ